MCIGFTKCCCSLLSELSILPTLVSSCLSMPFVPGPGKCQKKAVCRHAASSRFWEHTFLLSKMRLKIRSVTHLIHLCHNAPDSFDISRNLRTLAFKACSRLGVSRQRQQPAVGSFLFVPSPSALSSSRPAF